MNDLRNKIADIIDRETNARLVQDEIDILNGHDVAQSIIAALPGMVATEQAAENKRLRSVLEDVVHDCQAEYPPSHWAIKRYVESVLQVKP